MIEEALQHNVIELSVHSGEGNISSNLLDEFDGAVKVGMTDAHAFHNHFLSMAIPEMNVHKNSIHLAVRNLEALF